MEFEARGLLRTAIMFCEKSMQAISDKNDTQAIDGIVHALNLLHEARWMFDLKHLIAAKDAVPPR